MANTPFRLLPITVGSLTGGEILPLDQGGTTKSATARQVALAAYTAFPAMIEFIIDGGGSAITAGSTIVKGYLEVPFTATITQVTAFADRTGSIVVDIWKCTQSQFDAGATHPVVGDSITSATPPTITAGTKYLNTSLSGWTTSLAAGDILGYNVSSASAIQRVTVSLKLARSLV